MHDIDIDDVLDILESYAPILIGVLGIIQRSQSTFYYPNTLVPLKEERQIDSNLREEILKIMKEAEDKERKQAIDNAYSQKMIEAIQQAVKEVRNTHEEIIKAVEGAIQKTESTESAQKTDDTFRNEIIKTIQEALKEGYSNQEEIIKAIERAIQKTANIESEGKKLIQARADDAIKKLSWDATVSRKSDPEKLPDFTEQVSKAQQLTGLFQTLEARRSIMLNAVFRAIDRISKEEKWSDFSHFSLDIPLKIRNQKEAHLVRVFRYKEREIMDFFVLDQNTHWQKEPMFPRLYFVTGNELIEKKLPESVRREAHRILASSMGGKKSLFTPQQQKLLALFVREPDLSTAAAAKKIGISEGTVSGYLKEIARIGLEAFDIVFNPGKTLAIYWNEMGLPFDE